MFIYNFLGRSVAKVNNFCKCFVRDKYLVIFNHKNIPSTCETQECISTASRILLIIIITHIYFICGMVKIKIQNTLPVIVGTYMYYFMLLLRSIGLDIKYIDITQKK